MTEAELSRIEYFTKNEIEGTGSMLRDINALLIYRLNEFRRLIKRRVVLLPNGLTTGEHTNINHYIGKASDNGFCEGDGSVDIIKCFKAALSARFKGIGLYWNGIAYSIHLDIGRGYRFWSAKKGHRETEWTYYSLINDPARMN